MGRRVSNFITKLLSEESTAAAAVAADVTAESSGGYGWLYVALAVVLVVLVLLVVDTIMRYRYKKARAEKRAKRKRQAERQNAAASKAGAPAAESTIAVSSNEVTVIGNIMDLPKDPVSAAYFQDIGAREDQQDSYGMTDLSQYGQYGAMAVVADGMGGLANGKAVSSTLVRTFVEGFGVVAAYPRCSDALLDLAIRANEQINRMLQGQERSGSTLVSALIKNGQLYFLTVGDSRLYLYRGGALLQLNREHIYQEELAVKAVSRQISIQQVSGDRQAQSLTSYFGIGKIPCIDRNHEGIKLLPGDRLLLASDGVFGTLSPAQMEQALSLPLQEAAQTMANMVREAEKPYQDNNTGLILEYQG